ncbi:glycosyl hydrolase family 28-related protein [Phaeobacter gallaeciensis]|uniref:glycosyl hydrolase family 28-related protein n=1 Tax=Phaeobacter gallaeciensis TaxID=60890 RepID=UPI00237F081B|nr:glycosyl hydrolase family 28-related protein [Phaeobacter gallaeciensis]MDE4193311.1 glycosyl hydrolase family 28-related protein [Phaeobacter gallaeciensis]MDE4201573.1 glycosyl hydrolase family 28-related protein [Phaeobacter gallaeciensis]MDE4205757.1 glycosyl hydrolase family 28-related protein [Phaeobacter gallaeciensis]MDE4209920.1 glycosyl hydrolase family 28-related protein [Phaeobacter gallaeciensis]MDE4218264.1 glycosyl hydrolase family 28-related protein [Phaeobacter gallaeciensi
MNKVITDGLQLAPSPFEEGLDQWSSGDGTPGSDTYDGVANAAYVAADADFGGCLELQKLDSTQKLRFMGQTPILPGCYLQVRARIKAISGALPTVRVAGWAGQANNSHLSGVVETGTSTTLTSYGQVVEITAIVGTGSRSGVDMPWGLAADHGHFGLDLIGPNGGVVRIDDIDITDITSAFLRDMISLVDVTDFGAIGDGVQDNTAAFEAADAAADGRRVLVPDGEFFLGETVSMDNEMLFEGTLTMPTDKMLILRRNFDFPAYAAAFGDEERAFKKAFQALLNNVDHESLDLRGRMITVTKPIDMQAAVPNRSSYATRRVIRNGQFSAVGGAAWDTETVSSQATYDSGDPRKLRNVANIANIPIGALVEGSGVGREIYVRAKNTGAGELTLNAPLYDAVGTQNFTFKDFKYLLDFSGFSQLSKFGMTEVEVQCNSHCSALRLPSAGTVFSLDHCFISRPKDRGITSIGSGCQGILVDNCQFLSAEEPLDVPDRSSVAINVNANDAKLRNNRASKFRHFALLAGANNTVTGNHFFQGDSIANGVRTAGLVLTNTYCSTTVSDNYIDNCFVEWTNEQDPTPDFSSGFSFSALSVTDNVFLSGEVAPWFSYIVVKPYGTGHFLNGVTVSGNKFRSINGFIDRAERVDTSFSGLDFSRSKMVFFEGNTFHGITSPAASPLRLEYTQGSAATTWIIDTDGQLPFEGHARKVDAITALGPISTSGGSKRYAMPYAEVEQGSGKDRVKLNWQDAVKGEVQVIVRVDR